MSTAIRLEARARSWGQRNGLVAAVRVDFIDRLGHLPLADAEDAVVARAAPKRRAEFRAGRHVAHLALQELGLDAPLPRRDNGAPEWPPGVVGSISHGGGLCTALVLRNDEVSGCGVDVEDAAGALEPAVASLILTPHDKLPPVPVPARLALSAKEAAYKSVAHLGLRAIEPRDWTVQLDVDGTFAPISAPASVEPFVTGTRFTGFWHIQAGTIFTAAVVWRRPRQAAANPTGAL